MTVASVAANFFYYVIHNVRYMFYLVLPSETMYEKLDQVPRLVVEVSDGNSLRWPINYSGNCSRLLSAKSLMCFERCLGLLINI